MSNNKSKFIKIISVFMGTVLLLTFFSKTIYNYNLPTVTVIFQAQGKLITTVEGNAPIEYADSHNIYAKKDGRIEDILVVTGQEINRGQLLLTYELDTEYIDQLTLDIQKKEQSINQLASGIDNARFIDLDLRLEHEKEKILDLKTEINSIEADISAIENGTYSNLKKSEYEANLSAIENGTYSNPRKSEFEANIRVAENNLKTKEVLYSAGALSRSEVVEAENGLLTAQLQYEQYIQSEIQSEKEKYDQYMKSEKESKNGLIKSKQEQIKSMNENIFLFEIELNNELRNADSAASDIHQQMIVAKSELALMEKKLLKAQNVDVLADTDGIVLSIGIEKGAYVSATQNRTLFQIAELSDELKTELIIDEDKLNFLGIQSHVEIKVKGVREVLSGEIKAIDPYKDESGSKYMVTIILRNTNNELAGKQADITLKTESEQYDYLIPNYALRKDEKGYYVLVLREEISVLSNNYVARKVSVDLLDSDGSMSAVRGLLAMEPIISASTSAIDHGSRVKYEAGGEK